MFKRFIGDKAFYRRSMLVAIPIIIQNGITNFVSLLDNIMVGQVGTIPMSGVTIVNQLIFVFNLCLFGATSGPGIFTAQFYGSGDHEGIRHTFRFKFLICTLLALLGIAVFSMGGTPLINLYLTGEGDPTEASQMLSYGLQYLEIMLIGFLPFAICNAYASTLRESGETLVPMLASVAAVLVNLVLNYILIFGKFGAPVLGVAGAAWATSVSRFVELGIVAGWAHLHPEKMPFVRGAYRSFRIPRQLTRDITFKGLPLLVNEFFWASGMAFLSQCYSTCGLDVVPAFNIANTLNNLTSVAFLAMGTAVGIIMGQMLGAGNSEDEIRTANNRLIFVAIACGLVFGAAMAFVSGLFPLLYNTTESIRQMAKMLILIAAGIMPFNAYTTSTYFTLRSGGKSLVTFLFDSCFVWFIIVPIAFCLSRFTAITIIPLYLICQCTDFIKCALGYWMIKKGDWIQNLVQ